MAAIEHGTNNAYTNRKCRCDECRDAMREYERERRRARYVDAPAASRNEDLADLLRELFPLGLTDDAPARKAKRGMTDPCGCPACLHERSAPTVAYIPVGAELIEELDAHPERAKAIA